MREVFHEAVLSLSTSDTLLFLQALRHDVVFADEKQHYVLSVDSTWWCLVVGKLRRRWKNMGFGVRIQSSSFLLLSPIKCIFVIDLFGLSLPYFLYPWRGSHIYSYRIVQRIKLDNIHKSETQDMAPREAFQGEATRSWHLRERTLGLGCWSGCWLVGAEIVKEALLFHCP